MSYSPKRWSCQRFTIAMERMDEEDNLVGDMWKKGSVILLIGIFFNIMHAWNIQNSYGIEKMFFERWELLARRNDPTNLLDFNLEQINDVLCISRRL